MRHTQNQKIRRRIKEMRRRVMLAGLTNWTESTSETLLIGERIRREIQLARQGITDPKRIRLIIREEQLAINRRHTPVALLPNIQVLLEAEQQEKNKRNFSGPDQ
jgi:hypothetical protein